MKYYRVYRTFPVDAWFYIQAKTKSEAEQKLHVNSTGDGEVHDIEELSQEDWELHVLGDLSH